MLEEHRLSKQIDMIFIDFAKAFDTVFHQLLHSIMALLIILINGLLIG